jgi:hypothetical protein
LHLDPCRITDAGMKILGEIKSLKELQLVSEREITEITDEGLAALGAATKLEKLVLPQSRATGTGFSAFDPDPLVALSIDRWAILDTGVEQIARFRNLRQLDLSGCTIDDRELKLLAEKLPQLERLGLGLTSVSDEGFAALLGLKKLVEINAADTKLTVAFLGKMLKQNPELRVWAADTMAPQTAGGGWSGRFQAITVE